MSDELHSAIIGPRDYTVTSKSATISECGLYRYDLWRSWAPGRQRKGYVVFIGLNPSTADANNDDPTIRRCLGFAKGWEYDGICMVNAFAYRSTDPSVLGKVDDPIGPENDGVLALACMGASIVIAAWGVQGAIKDRDHQIRQIFPNLYCLGKNSNGTPKHPLYLSSNARAIPL